MIPCSMLLSPPSNLDVYLLTVSFSQVGKAVILGMSFLSPHFMCGLECCISDRKKACLEEERADPGAPYRCSVSDEG